MILGFIKEILVIGLGVLLAIWIESQTRCKLQFTVSNKHEINEDRKDYLTPATWLRVLVKNEPINKYIGLFYDRQPASDCRANIIFSNLKSKVLFTMEGRWSNNPRPEILKFDQDGKPVVAIVG